MAMNDALYSNLINLFYAIIIAAGIIAVITTGSNNENAASALIGGYSAMAFSIFALAALLFNAATSGKSDMGGRDLVKILIHLFPFAMIMFILVLMITFLSTYFDKIAANKVSQYYNSFSTVNMIFLAMQMGMLFNALHKTGAFKMASANTALSAISSTTYAVLMLLGTINSISAITLGVILKY